MSRGIATIADGTAGSGPTLSEQHVDALTARGLDPEVLARYGAYTSPARFNGSDGLAIPIVRDGKVINHKYRGPRVDGKAQQLQDRGAPRSFVNEDVLADLSLAGDALVITEGEFDMFAALQAGHARTVSVLDGANSNLDFMGEPQLWKRLESVARIVLAGDGDEPGRKLNGELARRLGAARCAWVSYPEGCKDLNDVLREHGETAVLAAIRGAKPYPIDGVYKLSDYPEVSIEHRRVGWLNLDKHLKLFVPELMVISGIPQSGKSKIATHILMQQVEMYEEVRCGIFSGELPVKPYLRHEMRRFHGGSDEEADAWIEEKFVFIGADPRTAEQEVDAEWMVEKAGDAVIRYGINWLLIDPWNQLEHKRKRSESVEEYQERQLREFNRFRRSFGCSVMIVAHPTKEVKQRDGTVRVPNLYDIAGSAHWFNAPDHGLVVDRPDMTRPEVRVLVKKVRFMPDSGMPGEAWLRFNAKSGRFEASAYDGDPTNDGRTERQGEVVD